MVLINPLNISIDVKIAALLTLFFLTTLFLFLISLKHKQRNEEEQVLPLPPGPHGVPILGSLPFLNSNLHRYFAGLARTYGPVLSLRLGSKICVVISSPSAAREIFKDHDAAFANHVVPAAILFCYRSSNLDLLSAPYGTHWRMLRKIVVRQILGTTSVEAVAPLRCREMRRTVKALWNQAKMGATVGVRETAFLTTFNMMTNMLWGDDVAGSGEAKDFRQALEGIIYLFLAPNVADFFPVLAPLDPQGLGRRLGKIMDWIKKHLDEIVEKKRQKMASGERRRDVLEALLDLIETGNPREPFTMDDLFKLIIVSTM